MGLKSLFAVFLVLLPALTQTGSSMTDSKPLAKPPSEYNPLNVHSPISIGENNSSNYRKNPENLARYDKDIHLKSKTEKTSPLKVHTIHKRENGFVERLHYRDESFYNRTFPKIKISQPEHLNVHEDNIYASEEPAPHLQETDINHSSNDVRNVPESQLELKSGQSQHEHLPKLKNKHTLKRLNRNSHHKNDSHKHHRKHLKFTNKNAENDQENTFGKKHKKHHKLEHDHRKESGINNHLHNHNRSHHHNLDATKKKDILSNSSRHIRLVNSSKSHHSKSNHKERTSKKTFPKVKNRKHSFHRSPSRHTRKRTHDHASRKLKKHYIHGIKPNHIRMRSFDDHSRRRDEHKKHLRTHKHHGKRSLKESRIVAHHGHDTKNSPKFLKELTNKFFNNKMSKRSMNKLLEKYFSEAVKKYHKNTISKKLYKKYSKLKLPDHAIAVKDAFIANGTKDQKGLNEETIIKPNGSEHSTKSATNTSVTGVLNNYITTSVTSL